MARPPNQRVAARRARELLSRRMPGLDPTTVREHVIRAERVADVIWRRWQVGPWQWQVKHLRWYLECKTKGMRPGTRYRYWLTIRALVYALGRGRQEVAARNGEPASSPISARILEFHRWLVDGSVAILFPCPQSRLLLNRSRSSIVS
jgi:hypothetical protein